MWVGASLVSIIVLYMSVQLVGFEHRLRRAVASSIARFAPLQQNILGKPRNEQSCEAPDGAIYRHPFSPVPSQYLFRHQSFPIEGGDLGSAPMKDPGSGCRSVESPLPPLNSFIWCDTLNSTMDKARALVLEKASAGYTKGEVFAVAAKQQRSGRGTNGRAWVSLEGNVFLTVVVPIDSIPIPLHLTSLRVGTLLASEIRKWLAVDGTALTLKWPNDVLIEGAKVAGVLIESELPCILIGIGVNVRQAPAVPNEGKERGRVATCLAAHGAASDNDAVKSLAEGISMGIARWITEGEDSAQTVLRDWKEWVDWSQPLEIREERRKVTPLGVNSDGTLNVMDNASGREEILAAEYLY